MKTCFYINFRQRTFHNELPHTPWKYDDDMLQAVTLRIRETAKRNKKNHIPRLGCKILDSAHCTQGLQHDGRMCHDTTLTHTPLMESQTDKLTCNILLKCKQIKLPTGIRSTDPHRLGLHRTTEAPAISFNDFDVSNTIIRHVDENFMSSSHYHHRHRHRARNERNALLRVEAWIEREQRKRTMATPRVAAMTSSHNKIVLTDRQSHSHVHRRHYCHCRRNY